jgi:prolipoprotein diacylglyceryltransferase
MNWWAIAVGVAVLLGILFAIWRAQNPRRHDKEDDTWLGT